MKMEIKSMVSFILMVKFNLKEYLKMAILVKESPMIMELLYMTVNTL